ncbi:electron transport complex subunit RsxB [Candidatus Albibeggiatoa sp. nov. NOAA]|uniref:electron transport complex subunit RsxB n=1 Tax=Candidatus Albibeggiatoa sp. nov. NOAA TaxID=3162724 RepID=UPI0032FCB7FD|nr:electron transport complex subunit RsxB [Thiotrichaceae bacterium]
MLTAIAVISVLALFFGLLLGYAAIQFKVESNPIVDQIDALLPQQQCGKCTFPGCRPYAEAMANDEAEINQCPPGGETTMLALAELLDKEPKPLDGDDDLEENINLVAVIDEKTCIGCTLCIQACPVDAILGSAKHMHTVIAKECTGCELCLPPCPVDCITMEPIPETTVTWKWPYPIHTMDVEQKKAA